ncbi:MAG: hypothetical protein ACFNYJ_06885 [Segatella oris]
MKLKIAFEETTTASNTNLPWYLHRKEKANGCCNACFANQQLHGELPPSGLL